MLFGARPSTILVPQINFVLINIIYQPRLERPIRENTNSNVHSLPDPKVIGWEQRAKHNFWLGGVWSDFFWGKKRACSPFPNIFAVYFPRGAFVWGVLAGSSAAISSTKTIFCAHHMNSAWRTPVMLAKWQTRITIKLWIPSPMNRSKGQKNWKKRPTTFSKVNKLISISVTSILRGSWMRKWSNLFLLNVEWGLKIWSEPYIWLKVVLLKINQFVIIFASGNANIITDVLPRSQSKARLTHRRIRGCRSNHSEIDSCPTTGWNIFTRLQIQLHREAFVYTSTFATCALSLWFVFPTEKDYDQAITFYTEAITRNPFIAAYYGNRSFAYLRTECFGYALSDANKALELDNTYIKVKRQTRVKFSVHVQSFPTTAVSDDSGAFVVLLCRHTTDELLQTWHWESSSWHWKISRQWVCLCETPTEGVYANRAHSSSIFISRGSGADIGLPLYPCPSILGGQNLHFTPVPVITDWNHSGCRHP